MSSADPNALLHDLFRQEVQSQVQVLSDGLVQLEQNPHPRQVEPLMRAAHSIKGAARLMNIEPAVKIAHAMEDCLVAVQHGSHSLGARDIDLLLAGTDWLGQIGEAVGSKFNDWCELNLVPLTAVIAQLEGMFRASARAASVSSPQMDKTGQPAGTHAPPTQSASAVDVTNDIDVPLEDVQNKWQVWQPDAIDPGTLALFQEVLHQGGLTLSAVLAKWQAPLSGHDVPPVQESLANMRGSALLLRVEPLATLIRDYESAWQAARPTERAGTSQDVQCFAQTNSLIEQLAHAVGADYLQRVEELRQELDACMGQLRERMSLPPAGATGQTPNSAPPSRVDSSSTAPPEVGQATDAVLKGVAGSRVVEQSHTEEPARPTIDSAKQNTANTAVESPDAQERVVRVTAKNLNRLMGLAGESLVEARWLQPFAQSLANLKRQQDRLTDIIDELDQVFTAGTDTIGHAIVKEMRSKLLHNQCVLASRIEEFESHARRSDDLNSRLYNEVIACRMRPLSDGVQGYPRMVRDVSRQLGKNVRYEIVGETTPVDRDVLEKLDAPLNHILRNAIDHGIETPEQRVAAGKPETATLKLEARHSAGMFAITISDDGRGIDLEKLRAKVVERKLTTAEMATRMTDAELFEFLFLPGFSTRSNVTEISGRGVGLDVVHTMATSVGGSVRVQSQLGKGTSFHLHLPITLSVIRAVLVEIAGEPYAFPLNRIDRLLQVASSSLGSLEHRQFLRVNNQNVGVVLATQILRLSKQNSAFMQADSAPLTEGSDEDLFLVLFSNHNDQYGLIVDRFLGEQDLVVRPLDQRLGKVPNVSAAAVLDDGSPALIMDVDDVRRAIERLLETGKLERTDESLSRATTGRKKRVLVVDDSITVREVERQLLTSRGYDVTVAVDGADGWNTIREGEYDLVISDIDMPHMNGIEFTKKIKSDNQLQRIPVVIVSYKDRDADRLAGMEAGANYYLTKSSFHDESLLDAVRELIGDAQ